MNLSMRRMLFVFATIFCLTGLTANAQPYDLRWNLSRGEVVWFRSTIKQDIQTEAAGQKMTMQQNMLFDCKLTVKDIEPGSIYVLEALVDHIAMEMKSPQMSMTVDSAKPDSVTGLFAPMINALKGAVFMAKMDSKGDVKELTGLSEFVTKLTESTARDSPEAGEALKKMFDPESIQSTIEQSTACFPPNPVNIGDEWTQNMELKMGMAMSIAVTYRLEKVDSQTVTVSLKSVIKSPEAGTDLSQGNVSIKMNMSGISTGTMILDRTTMMLKSSESVQDIDMTTTVSEPGKDIQTMPMNAHSVQTVEVRK